MGIQFFSLTFLVGVIIGAFGLWVLQNGWGKVLALYHKIAG